MTPIQIRIARAEDGPDVSRIYIDSWNKGFGSLMRHREFTTRNVDRWTRDLVAPVPYHWWVALIDDAVVGFAGIGTSRDPVDPNLGELDTIAVDPNHWRVGVGSALMSTVLEQLRKDSYPEAILWTLENYPRGQQYYESMGWSRDGGVRDNGTQIRYRIRLGVLSDS